MMKWKICQLFILSFLALALHAQQKSEITEVISKLNYLEKIDLLCAKYPGEHKYGLIKYDWWSECLHGVARAGKATVFPKPIAMGATWDKSLIKRIADAISDEARAKHENALKKNGFSDRHYGLTFFSPTLNIARDPRWGRTSECFSEDPLLTSDMGVAFISGLQGDDKYYLKAVATAKHFVANNEENRRLNGSANVDELSLREYYFPAFRAAVEKGKVASVMGAYNSLNGIPCCANSYLLTDVLRKEWGFNGVVISDGSAIDKLYTHHKYVSCLEEGAAMALKAGCDMSLRDEYRVGLKKAYEKGLIDDEDLSVAAIRVLNLRSRLGLDTIYDVNNPYKNIPYSVVECKKHQDLALEAATKSIVLLKNDGLLPLKKRKDNPIKIALIGDAFRTIYYGDYSGTPDNNLTLLDCIKSDIDNSYEIKWVGERDNEVTIPANCLYRAENHAYDGILGFSSDYYESDRCQGPISLSRQDLTLDLYPNEDQSIKNYKEISACWSSSLKAPLSGRYTISFSASGNCRIIIDGKTVLQKNNKQGFKATFDAAFDKGKTYPINIICEGINRNCPISLTWKTPFNENEANPVSLAKQSDVAILFLRDDNSSEGRDRKDLKLNESYIELIKDVTSANANTILLLGGSTSLSLTEISKLPKSILYAWIGGQGESKAISNILFGKTNPSGKIPLTFYKDESQLPPLDDYNIKNGRSYEYFKGDILYPFGYGLSYTEFRYDKPQIKIGDKLELLVSTTITNTGEYDGDEIVQCYLSSPSWEATGLIKKLVGYKRISIKKGESKMVEFNISEDSFKRWNIKEKEWKTSRGEFSISLVPNSGEHNDVSFTY